MKWLSLLLLSTFACLAQVPPFIRNSLDTNAEPAALNVITNIVNSLVSTGGVSVAAGTNIFAVTNGNTVTISAPLSRGAVTNIALAINSFTPASISNLLVWNDPVKVTNAVNTGVATWLNQASSSFNATQGVGAAQPVYRFGNIGNQACLEFNGASSFGFDSLNMGTLNTNVTIFMVTKKNTTVATYMLTTEGLASGIGIRATFDANTYQWAQQGGAYTITPGMTDPQAARIDTLQYDGAYIRVRENGVGVQDQAMASTLGITNGLFLGTLLGVTTGINNFSGYMGDFLIYNRALTPAECSKVEEYLKAKYNFPQRKLVFIGDSLTQGVNSTGGSNYPAQVAALIGGSQENSYVNSGISGRNSSTILTFNLTNYCQVPRQAKDEAVFWAGSNDLVTDATNVVFNSISNNCQLLKSAGYKVNVIQILLRPATIANQTVSNLNSLLAANWPTFADNYISFTEAEMQSITNGFDGVHPTVAGYAVVAAKVASYVKQQLNGNNLTLYNPNNNTVLSVLGNVAGYGEVNVQNLNQTAGASSDLVATGPAGTGGTNHYIDFGYNGPAGGGQPFTNSNEAYLYSIASNNVGALNIAAIGSNALIRFSSGAPTVSGGVINPHISLLISNNSVAIGADSVGPSNTLYVAGTLSVTSRVWQAGLSTNATPVSYLGKIAGGEIVETATPTAVIPNGLVTNGQNYVVFTNITDNSNKFLFTNGQAQITGTNWGGGTASGASNIAQLVIMSKLHPTNEIGAAALDLIGDSFLTGATGSNQFRPTFRIAEIPTVGSSAQTLVFESCTNSALVNGLWQAQSPWTTNATLSSGGTWTVTAVTTSSGNVVAGNAVIATAQLVAGRISDPTISRLYVTNSSASLTVAEFNNNAIGGLDIAHFRHGGAMVLNVSSNGIATAGTSTNVTVFSTGVTNTSGTTFRVFGLTGVSLTLTSGSDTYSLGTITVPTPFTLQTNEYITGTSVAAAGTGGKSL